MESATRAKSSSNELWSLPRGDSSVPMSKKQMFFDIEVQKNREDQFLVLRTSGDFVLRILALLFKAF